jgi:hypothetical protein
MRKTEIQVMIGERKQNALRQKTNRKQREASIEVAERPENEGRKLAM